MQSQKSVQNLRKISTSYGMTLSADLNILSSVRLPIRQEYRICIDCIEFVYMEYVYVIIQQGKLSINKARERKKQTNSQVGQSTKKKY